MKVAIMSDTHDNLPLIRKAIDLIKEKNIEIVLHCGDLVAPAVIDVFNGVKMYYVRGNCDGDIVNIVRKLEKIGGKYLKDFGTVEINGVNIALYHGHNIELLLYLKTLKTIDVLCYGHTHKINIEHLQTGNKTLIAINPGSLHIDAPKKTFAILDIQSMEFEIIEL